jgi:ribosome-associated translation inhibitor RaiA
MSQMESDFTNIGKIVYYGAIQNFIFQALSNALFALLPGWEGEEDPDLLKQLESEKEKKARILHGMIDTMLRGSGIKGAVIASIKNVIRQYQRQEAKGWNADHTYTAIEVMNVAPPIGSKLRKLYKSHQTKKYDGDVVAERGWSITADGRLNLSPSYEILGNAVSAAFNIPLDRAIIEIESIVEATDNRNADWQRIALALGWRAWGVGARNEEEDLIKIIAKLQKKIDKRIERQKKKENSEEEFLKLLENE